MNLPTFDLDTLRTLVLANDLGGYGQAGARLGRTPSAVSLQMKRLQDQAGAPLFRKAGRGVSLTEAGEIVLRYARRMLAMNDELLDTVRGAALTDVVRLGCSQDFVDQLLPRVLARFASLYPLVMLEVRVDGNGAMADALEAGELDVVLAIGQAERPLATRVGEVALDWIASADFRPRGDQPLPLVLLGPKCAFRKSALTALEHINRPWRLAALSPSLAGLWASAQGGLGVTARVAANLPAGLVHGPTLLGLPELGPLPVTLLMRQEARTAAKRLRDLVEEALGAA